MLYVIAIACGVVFIMCATFFAGFISVRAKKPESETEVEP